MTTSQLISQAARLLNIKYTRMYNESRVKACPLNVINGRRIKLYRVTLTAQKYHALAEALEKHGIVPRLHVIGRAGQKPTVSLEFGLKF